MKKMPSQRHFAYRHPTFGTEKAPKSVSHWKGSVYYWWWAYLRKNADYIACCDAGGIGAMSDLYQDFGDVRGDDFKAWWSEGSRAIRLFAEPAAEAVVRELDGGEIVSDQSNLLTLVFPLNLPKRYLQKRFNQLLKKYHTGKQGVQYAKSSQARYRFEGQPNVPALKLAMKVYEMKLDNPKMKLWEIGNEMPGVIRTQKLKSTDDQYTKEQKKKVLAASVSRYLRRAQESIQRVGQGLSP
jgi:hypothetical protein